MSIDEAIVHFQCVVRPGRDLMYIVCFYPVGPDLCDNWVAFFNTLAIVVHEIVISFKSLLHNA